MTLLPVNQRYYFIIYRPVFMKVENTALYKVL